MSGSSPDTVLVADAQPDVKPALSPDRSRNVMHGFTFRAQGSRFVKETVATFKFSTAGAATIVIA